MLSAGSDILGCIIDQVEILFANLGECTPEPSNIESAIFQFINGQGRKAGNARLADVIEVFVHVCHEIIRRRPESRQANDFFHQFHPFRTIKRRFNQPLFADFPLLDQLAQIINGIRRLRNTYGQQSAQALCTVIGIAIHDIVTGAHQFILTQRRQNSGKVLCSPDTEYSRNQMRVRCCCITAL